MKAVRIIAIVLVALTATVNVVGGAGTSCAAFTPYKYPSMQALIPLQWLYQLLVVTVIAAGLAGAWTTYTLARARKNSYMAALIVVMAGMVLAIVQMAASRALRGKSMPTDLRLYVSIVTLLVLLALRLPGIWQKSGMGGASSGSGSWTTPTGTAAIVMGLTVLTVPLWVGQSHTFDGFNWVYAWDWQLLLGGALLVLTGIVLLARGRFAHRPFAIFHSPFAVL
jgi:lysylphosphatidylglycerol synthetase-like protein (DUF2156 family)